MINNILLGGNQNFNSGVTPRLTPVESRISWGNYRPYGISRQQKTRWSAGFRVVLDPIGSRTGGDGGNRTRVRKHSALGSTCLVSPFNLIAQAPADQDFE